MRRALVAVVSLCVLLSPPARADDLGLVAVLPFGVTGPNEQHIQLDTLTETIRTETGDALSPLGYTVLTGDNTLRILQDNGIDPAKVCDGSCALDVAKEMKARLFVSGIVSTTEGDLVAFVRIFDGANGRQLGSMQLEGKNAHDLRVGFMGKSGDFFRAAVARLREAGDVPVVETASKVPVLVEAPTTGDHFKVTLQNAEGVKACPQEVTFLQPCKLKLPPGPFNLKVSGTSDIEKPFDLKAPGVHIKFEKNEKEIHWTAQPAIGITAFTLGLLGMIGFGTWGIVDNLNDANGGPPTAADHAQASTLLLYAALPATAVMIAGLIVLFTSPNPPQAVITELAP